jgi:hypothetical protein
MMIWHIRPALFHLPVNTLLREAETAGLLRRVLLGRLLRGKALDGEMHLSTPEDYALL